MKTRFFPRLKKLAATLSVPAAALLSAPLASGLPFTTGNIAVLQEGDGTTALSTASSPIAILEYTTGGGLVQAISIPTNGVNRLTQSSGSASEGFLERSVNTSNLVFVGYDAVVGIANVPGTSASGTNRCVGQIDYNGNYTRAATGSSTAYTGSNVRSATSDGTNYWMSGTGSPTSNGGIWYSANGATPAQVSGGNLRVSRIFNGTLYGTTASGTVGLFAYSGLPASSAVSNSVFVTGGSPYDFSINATGTVAYVCDDGTFANGGGIQKWTFNGSTWTKKFTFAAANGLTAGCRSLAVDFSGAHPVLFSTTADTVTKVIKITDNSAFGDTSDTADQATTLATAAANYAFRGVALAPVNPAAGPPVITGISPSSITNGSGASVQFLVTATGSSPFSYFWYKETGSSTNLIAGATTAALVFPSAAVSDTANYQVIVSNLFSPPLATSAVVSLTITAAPPTISGISPSSVTTNAGNLVTFTVTASGAPPLGYQWLKETGSGTNLIAGATTSTLTLPAVLTADAASYQAVVTNSSLTGATSDVVSLTVVDDPHIAAQPANTFGLLNGTVQFLVSAIGTPPISYRWYFTDGSGNVVAPVTDGHSTASGLAVVSGANASTLTIANLQLPDPTNVLVVISNVYGIQTSSVASLLAVTNTAVLAFWDFNGPEFTNFPVNPTCAYNPVPYIGSGTAMAVGTCFNPGNIFTTASSPFSGSVDPNDGLGFTSHLPPFSWGTDNYPASGGNKQNGVQFNVSTLGAKNIKVSYQSRVSATASDYERLQYTTNGISWIDYPASSTFSNIGTTYLQYNYDLSGFPGVANNSSFAVRVVTEFQNTATYGVGTPNSGVISNYVGTANSYGTAGTVTYDLVTFSGDAITNSNVPPTISSIPDTNSPDYVPLTINFTVSDDTTSPDLMTYSATALNPTTVNPGFVFGGSGPNRTLTINPNTIPDPIDVGPILVTVTDGNGDSTATWFLLTLSSVNLPPTNSLVSLKATNTLANTPITIPFLVGDDRTAPSGLTYTNTSGNSTLIPAENIVINGAGTANPSVTITPATNQIGVANISVTVYDNDAQEPRSTTATMAVTVRPNTNIIAIDYFNYDQSGSLDAISAPFWQHLSGNFGQMQVGGGAVTVNTRDNTENLQTALLGAPYTTNSGGVLYASFIVNMDPARQPFANGSYFTAFNDGSGNTANVEGLVVAATNGAAPGFYHLGIANVVGANATNSQMFPLDLSPGSNYIVVASLALSNGFSTLWINPSSPASARVTDTTPAATATNLYSISQFEFRESGSSAGSINVSKLKVGTTFDSVLPSLRVQQQGNNAVISWSDPTLTIQSATNVTGPYVDVDGGSDPYTIGITTNPMRFFQFKH